VTVTKILAVAIGFASWTPTHANEPTPTALEAFASAPDTRIKQAMDVGKLDSADALLNITALVLVNDGHQAGEMKGVRFALKNNVGMDTIYLDPAQLDRLRRDLNGLEIGKEALADLEKDEPGSDAPYKVQGTESCWNPKSTARIMCPGAYTTPDGVGISLGALFSPVFQFPNRSAKELMQLVETSLRALGEPVPVIGEPHASVK
jgi:hypothetical protein